MGNVDVAGSGLYMWNDREQRKGMLVERRDLWSVPTMSPSWGRVKFAPDMDTQYSQKGDSDSLWSEVMKSFPSISCTCAGPLLGTCALLSIPMMSLSLSKNCFPRSGRITFHTAILTSTCSLSLPQPLYSTVLVLRFKWGNHRSISNLNFYQITQVGKLQLAMTFFFWVVHWSSLFWIAHQLASIPNFIKILETQTYYWSIRALVVVELNSYIVILALPKHKNQPYNSGAKGIFFTFIATVHNYLWLCTVAES